MEKITKFYPRDWRILFGLIVTSVWLLIGALYITNTQKTVLAENNRELRSSNIVLEKQAVAIAATELNARQETFFKIAEIDTRM